MSADRWMRECQACGVRQVSAPPPVSGASQQVWTRFENRRCVECGSMALDFGYQDVADEPDDDDGDGFVAMLLCGHQWVEQSGEPPVDVCVLCGAVRE